MGLLKTAATVAVASSVHGRIQRRQQNRWAARDQARSAAQDQSSTAAMPGPPAAQYAAPAQPQQTYAGSAPSQEPATPPQTADMSDRLAQLKQLGELLSGGVLTQAEFEQQKARILNG